MECLCEINFFECSKKLLSLEKSCIQNALSLVKIDGKKPTLLRPKLYCYRNIISRLCNANFIPFQSNQICLIRLCNSLIPLKHVSNLEAIELSGNVYDVLFVVVPGIGVGPRVQQDLDHVNLPEHGGQMKRGPAIT